MDQTLKTEARERILNAAIELFSQKGYDATRVNDIASAANVNKALIYYYFESKEDILDFMVHTLLDNAVSITLDFIQTDIVQMIKNGYLDIKPDRLHFVDDKAKERFLKNALKFYERLVDYVIEKRRIIRILMLESLKKGKHKNSLFHFADFMRGDAANPLFRTISDADRDFTYSDDMVVFKFFFSIIPIVSLAAYFDDYKEVCSRSDEEIRSSFLRVYQVIIASMVSGSDIMLQSNSVIL